MKAIQVVSGEKLVLSCVESKSLKSWEIRVRVALSCVCGSDLKNIASPLAVPQIPGHEFSGVVTEVSREAEEVLKVGDRVTSFPMMPCHSCEHCLKGHFRDCNHKLSLGFQLPGSFAEEVIVDARMAIVLKDDISFEQGALLEHLCCGYRLAIEVANYKIPLDSHIAILGDGPIALADLQALTLSGYKNITVIGKHSFRLNLAKELQASQILDVSEIDIKLQGNGISEIDVVILASQADELLKQISSLINVKCLVLMQTQIQDDLLMRKLTELEVIFGRAFAYELADFESVMDLVLEQKIKTEKLITNRIGLMQFIDHYPGVLKKHENLKTAIISSPFLISNELGS